MLAQNIEPTSGTTSLTWKELLASEKEKPYFKSIISFIEAERTAGKVIYPPNSEIFNALACTPFEKLSVVIIGQDPYHGAGQAHGLSFSVKDGVRPPPSLKNIYKELHADLGVPISDSGNLERWAKQGVLLLNSSLSVEEGKPGSHAESGWQQFTDTIISLISTHKSGVVFLLWGAFAQKKAALVDSSKHTILQAPHPSPFSAHTGFFGCKHFSKTNLILTALGRPPIIW